MTEENEAYRLNDLIAIIPTWYERWGISLLIIIFIAFVLLSIVIQYPTVLTAEIDIATEYPPVNVYTRESGNYLPFVAEGQHVTAGTHLGILANPIELEDIIYLKNLLNQCIEEDDFQPLHQLDRRLVLGNMQELHSELVEAFDSYQRYANSAYLENLQRNLIDQIKKTKQINEVLQAKKQLLAQQLSFYHKKMYRDSTLFAQKVISEESAELANADWLERKQSIKDIDYEIYQNHLESQVLQESLMTATNDLENSLFRTQLNLQEAIKRLIGTITEWERSYLIKAPIDGQVTYLQKFSKNQFVLPQQALLAVVPDHGNYVGKLTLPVQGAGKVKHGQSVKIKLDHYPYQEYGLLEGTVSEVSLVPSEGAYLITIYLDNQLRTSYGIKIPFKQHLTGSAAVITEDMNLLQRVFGHVRALFNKNTNL